MDRRHFNCRGNPSAETGVKATQQGLAWSDTSRRKNTLPETDYPIEWRIRGSNRLSPQVKAGQQSRKPVAMALVFRPVAVLDGDRFRNKTLRSGIVTTAIKLMPGLKEETPIETPGTKRCEPNHIVGRWATANESLEFMGTGSATHELTLNAHRVGSSLPVPQPIGPHPCLYFLHSGACNGVPRIHGMNPAIDEGEV
jgi:hypothetical protein